MASIRPISRPTIRELTNFLFSTKNTSRSPRCLSRTPIHPARLPAHRSFTTTHRLLSAPNRTRDRGPVSTEDTQTDFGVLDVLGATPQPSTSIDACLWDGFHLNSGVKITGGTGVLLISGEAFSWRPWEARAGGKGELKMVNAKGQWEVDDSAWGVLELVWPKPDLLILGLGKEVRPISPQTRAKINSLGIRVELADTRNASAQFNLLATERGVGSVAAALIPIGWTEGLGVK